MYRQVALVVTRHVHIARENIAVHSTRLGGKRTWVRTKIPWWARVQQGDCLCSEQLGIAMMERRMDSQSGACTKPCAWYQGKQALQMDRETIWSRCHKSNVKLYPSRVVQSYHLQNHPLLMEISSFFRFSQLPVNSATEKCIEACSVLMAVIGLH